MQIPSTKKNHQFIVVLIIVAVVAKPNGYGSNHHLAKRSAQRTFQKPKLGSELSTGLSRSNSAVISSGEAIFSKSGNSDDNDCNDCLKTYCPDQVTKIRRGPISCSSC